MHIASAYNQIEIFKAVVNLGVDPKIRNKVSIIKAGEIPFHIACREGSYDIIQHYIEGAVASVNERSSDGWTPLFYSVLNGYLQITIYLIAHGADVNLVDFV